MLVNLCGNFRDKMWESECQGLQVCKKRDTGSTLLKPFLGMLIIIKNRKKLSQFDFHLKSDTPDTAATWFITNLSFEHGIVHTFRFFIYIFIYVYVEFLCVLPWLWLVPEFFEVSDINSSCHSCFKKLVSILAFQIFATITSVQ